MKPSSKSIFRSGLQQLESTMSSAVSKLWIATIHTDGNPIKTIIGFHTSDKRTKKDSVHRDKESEVKPVSTSSTSDPTLTAESFLGLKSPALSAESSSELGDTFQLVGDNNFNRVCRKETFKDLHLQKSP